LSGKDKPWSIGISLITFLGFYFPTITFLTRIFASFLSQFKILRSNIPILWT